MRPTKLLQSLLMIFWGTLSYCWAQSTITLNDAVTNKMITYIEVDASIPKFIDGVVYIQKEGKTYKRDYDGKINICWFGVKGDGLTDESKAIQKALDIGEALYFPTGVYKFSVQVNRRMEISGDVGNTIFKPVDSEKSILNFNTKAPYFTYTSVVENISFHSDNFTGTAISFGKNQIKNKELYDEYAGNVVFRNVHIKGFDKGIYFPYGNIGSNFYSCSFQANNYGIYALDNKMGGDAMHAGNKYFYANEFSSNKVAVYVNNQTDGFGGFGFYDCIFQSNGVNGYFNTNNTYLPLLFQNCWDEKGQAISEVHIDQYASDQWRGIKKYPPTSYIFEGKNASYIFIGGRVMDMKILGENIVVHSYSSQFEFQKGVGANDFEIAKTSNLKLYYPSTAQGIQVSPNIQVIGFPHLTDVNFSASNPEGNYIPMDGKKIQSTHIETFSTNFGKPVKLSGSFSPKNAVIEYHSGVKSNKLSLNFTAVNQYIGIEDTKIKLPKGFYFLSFQAKVNSGSPRFFIWDRNQNQLLRLSPIRDGKYHTYGAYGYLEKDAEVFMDISSSDGNPVDMNIEKYTIYAFDSLSKLKTFMIENVK